MCCTEQEEVQIEDGEVAGKMREQHGPKKKERQARKSLAKVYAINGQIH